jgi:acetyl esterase/lipase
VKGLDLSALAAPAAPETAAFTARLAETLAGLPMAHEVPAHVTRKAREAGGGVFPAGGPLAGSEWLEIEGAPGGPGRLRVSRPGGAPRGVYLHIHGGGWTFGQAEHYDRWNQALARESGFAVASVAYRLAPENPWPACGEDCLAAARWLLGKGRAVFGTDRLAIGGESAGAHLAAVTLQRLGAAAREFSGALLTYGAFDLRLTPSMAAAGTEALIVPTPTVQWFVDNLTGGDAALAATPALSPLLGDVSAFPPTLLLCGTADPLLDDTLLMAAALARAGVAAETLLWPGGVHAFDQFDDLPIAREAQAARAAFLTRLAAG